MVAILKEQYQLVQGSRQAMLYFLETKVGDGINTSVPEFEGKSMRYLLVHTINTYIQWTANFAMGETYEFFRDEDYETVDLIRKFYVEADNLMDILLNHYADKLNIPIDGTLSRNRHVIATPLEVFTHVLTHEFHHKGQVITICRLLGHIPPDTDIIRF